MKRNFLVLIICSLVLLLSSCHMFNQTQGIWILDCVNGKIEVEKLERTDSSYGVDILVKVYPDEGYELQRLWVFDASENEMLSYGRLAEKGENVYGISGTKNVPVITISAMFIRKQ